MNYEVTKTTTDHPNSNRPVTFAEGYCFLVKRSYYTHTEPITGLLQTQGGDRYTGTRKPKAKRIIAQTKITAQSVFFIQFSLQYTQPHNFQYVLVSYHDEGLMQN